MEKVILPFGDPVLRKPSKPVTDIDNATLQLLGDMTDTLYAAEGRAGLAAPQVGASKRVIVMDCGDGLIELINPEIVEATGEQTDAEACLSFPGYSGIVKRAYHVKVKTLNRQGEWCFMEGDDLLARCFQHEIDHLDGILFIDRIEDGALFDNATGQKVSLEDAQRMSNGGKPNELAEPAR